MEPPSLATALQSAWPCWTDIDTEATSSLHIGDDPSL